MGFKYKYEHIGCDCCLELQGQPRCPHRHCPHILDNLEDLRHDFAFRSAVRHADQCTTYHRSAFMLVKRWGLQWPA